MGPHCSGTKAMADFVHRYFRVHIEPSRTHRPDPCEIVLADFRVWKYVVPLASLNMPDEGPQGGPVLVITMVRDCLSWMASLAEHMTDLVPCTADGHESPKKRRSSKWMADRVQMKTGPRQDPFAGTSFESVPDLWALYVGGYLSGAMLSDSVKPGPTFVIVRREDLVERPMAVCNGLERIGLPRRRQTLNPASVGDRRRMPVMDSSEGDVWKRLNDRLQAHSHLLQQLGY